jgi:PelA/Pel-15E family pectate lyase
VHAGNEANTIDNGATTLPLRFLALVVNATPGGKYQAAFERGLDYLFAAQYANGGWPQFFPLRKGGYYSHITFNDNAMVNVLLLLRAAAKGEPPYTFVDKARRARAKEAVARGVECILGAQIRQGDKLTAWCAQHDEKDLSPVGARKFEPPSLSGAESVGIVRFLMGEPKPSPEVIAAIEGAVAWFRAVAITGLRQERFIDAAGKPDKRVVGDPSAGLLWARFYELGSNRPIFTGRDGIIRYSLSEIEQERRAGYAYYGDWPAALLSRDYPQWRAKQGLR